MKKYRLKPEAVQFFNEKHATTIRDWDYWNKIGVDDNALEEIESPYLEYGHESLRNTDEISSSSTCGWDQKGTRFYFTIKFPSVKYYEHDKFSNGKTVRELMNKVQNQINYFFADFNNK